jgi:hypothetical protein
LSCHSQPSSTIRSRTISSTALRPIDNRPRANAWRAVIGARNGYIQKQQIDLRHSARSSASVALRRAVRRNGIRVRVNVSLTDLSERPRRLVGSF